MRKLPLSLLILLTTASLHAQDGSASAASGGFFNQWEAHASATQAKQPGWAVPLVTTTTGLIQVVRTDMLRQIAPTLTTTWNFDNSKGLNVIPWARTEIAFNLPPYLQHNSTAINGFGDVSFLGKYRLLSGNAQHGSYTLSAWVVATIPTGSYKNGSTDASVQPNMGGGKGWGNFDVQSTLGATLPTGNPAITASGRPVAWNTVAQYRIGKLFWPEARKQRNVLQGWYERWQEAGVPHAGADRGQVRAASL